MPDLASTHEENVIQIPPAADDIAEVPVSGDTEDIVPVVNQNSEVPIPAEASAAPTEPLDPELLLALGESTDDTPVYGEKILDNLASLWQPLLKKGLPKETKEKVLKEYIVPDNCRLLQAPKLNAEISAAVPDMVRNRDKNLVVTQQQLGTGITAINRAMEVLLKGQDKTQAVKHLSSACRILSDLHAMNTQNRIKLLTSSLDKTFLHVIQDSERDETIFGIKLSEKIKAAKAIEKQGLQIKKTTVPKPSTSAQAPPAGRPAYSGNWTAPSRYPSNRGGRGARRTTSGRRPYTAYPAPQTYKSPSQNKPRPPAP